MIGLYCRTVTEFELRMIISNLYHESGAFDMGFNDPSNKQLSVIGHKFDICGFSADENLESILNWDLFQERIHHFNEVGSLQTNIKKVHVVFLALSSLTFQTNKQLNLNLIFVTFFVLSKT